MSVPVIMEVERHHVVFMNKIQLVLVSIIVFQLIDRVLMRIERGLMGNDHVLACGCCTLHDVQCCHHGSGDAAYWSIGTTDNNSIHGFLTPGNPNISFYALHNLSGGQWRGCRNLWKCCGCSKP